MTWDKRGTEFSDDCANAGLSDAAYRTHSEAIGWIYRVESMDCRILKHLVRRFAGSDQWEIGVKDLVSAGFWADDGDAYVVEHHRDIVRQSIAAQRKKRERDKRAQEAYRQRNVSTNASAAVSDAASANISAYAVSQSNRQEALEVSEEEKPCDRCGKAPSRVDRNGARCCDSCSPSLWKESA